MPDLLGYSLGAMRERKLRAILTIAMVVIGAGLMTALNGLTTGMYQYIGDQFGTLGANVVMVLPGMDSTTRITEQTASVIRQINGVKISIPYVQKVATVQSAGTTASILVTGSDQRYLNEIFPNLKVEEGTLVSPQDSIGIVLGHSVAYPPDKARPFARLGSVVMVSFTTVKEKQQVTVKRSFVVRGILAEMGTSGMFLPVDKMAFMSLPAATSFFDTAGDYSGVNVITSGPEKAEQVAVEIRRLYGRSFEVYTSKTMIQLIQNILGAFSMFLGSVASVSLIVASVGIFAGLYTSVMERTREIGLLKALGFKKRGILGVFLGEATLIGIIGGLLGDLLGVGLGYGMAVIAGQVRGEFTGELAEGSVVAYVPPAFTVENFLFIMAFSIAVSMLAGAYPAWRASRLDPVVALRKD
ncbi:FtsX-like permease family protein [Candidatus Bathyarchaeota archaeon]|nr:FtsX-like permease family protein [Candidatus Bathyarchaeota archaeon]